MKIKNIYFGMARSGYKGTRLLAKYNKKLVITDSKDQDISCINEFEN